MQKSNMLIHESHIAEHGEISNTSPIASSRPIGLVCTTSHPIDYLVQPDF